MKNLKCFVILIAIMGISSSAYCLVDGKENINNLGEMIIIPAGAFLMGNSGIGDDAVNSYENEKPQHSVNLDTYQIGKYEVTRGEYSKFINAGGYKKSQYWSDDGWEWKLSVNRTKPYYWEAKQDWSTGTFMQTDRHPVVGVTYYEAEAYCKWAGGRLPTEEEWEKAARWTGDHANVYPWGDIVEPQSYNNYYDSNPAAGGNWKYQSAPVGSYSSGKSPYGCEDMAGNVWEWCADWFKTYPGSSQQIDSTGKYRSIRGGSFVLYSFINRCAYRYSASPTTDNNLYIGLRIAR